MTFDEKVDALRDVTPPMQARKRKADCTPSESHADYIKAYRKRRRASSVAVRLREAMSSSINQSLRRALGGKLVRKETTMKLVGCTVQELMRHLESQFLPGMSWDNWGQGKGKWHIDQVFPASKATVSDPVLTATVFSYVNLRPMWGSANMSKSNALRWGEIHNHYMKEVSK